MPGVDIRETHEFTARQLEELFLSVEWSSGHYPERLVKAMRNFETVFAAWDATRWRASSARWTTAR